MKLREFITIVVGAGVAWPLAVRAQEAGRTYRLGFLTFSPRNAPYMVALFDELRRQGFIEGQNLAVGWREHEQQIDLISEFAEGLVKGHVDVIYASGNPAIRAVQRATTTLPILGISDDMVASGLVNSLARPGGNTTGISILATGLNGKRQEILIEAVPGFRHMGALADSNNTTAHDKTRNAKTTVCEVRSKSTSDKITAFAMKVRLHINQELNGSRRRAQEWTAKQIVQRSPSVFLTRLAREAERLMQANGSMFRRASKFRRASNRASIA